MTSLVPKSINNNDLIFELTKYNFSGKHENVAKTTVYTMCDETQYIVAHYKKDFNTPFKCSVFIAVDKNINFDLRTDSVFHSNGFLNELLQHIDDVCNDDYFGYSTSIDTLIRDYHSKSCT